MQELQSIFWQRNSDITTLKQKPHQQKKMQFLEKERSRIQRQNWVFKIIKTIRNLTLDNKKVIYQSVIRMMTYFSPTINDIIEENQIQYEPKFTQTFINLFVSFFNSCQFGDMAALKKVIRPNNIYIIIDLIKLFVESHRNFFKVKIMEIYKQKKPEQKKLQYRSLQVRKQILQSQQQSNISQQPKKEKQRDQTLTLQEKIKYCLYEKYLRYANNFFQGQVQQRVNTQYIELLYKNQTNGHLVKKFQEKCYGKVRNFTYDVSSLYSKQQIKSIQSKMENQWKNKYSQVTQLSGDCSDEQLKEYFKMKVQVQQNLDNMSVRRENKNRIVQWLPITLQKTGKQYDPLEIHVDTGKQLIPIYDLFQKFGLSIRAYIKKCISYKKPFDKNSSIRDLQMKTFRRYNYIHSLNRIKQILTDSHRVYQTKKRQSIFPLLRANQARQESQPKETIVKSKSINQYKLAPLFKNEVLNKKLHDKKQIINNNSQPFTQRLSDRKNSVSGKSRIDKIISQIISQRNLVVN